MLNRFVPVIIHVSYQKLYGKYTCIFGLKEIIFSAKSSYHVIILSRFKMLLNLKLVDVVVGIVQTFCLRKKQTLLILYQLRVNIIQRCVIGSSTKTFLNKMNNFRSCLLPSCLSTLNHTQETNLIGSYFPLITGRPLNDENPTNDHKKRGGE